MTKHKIKTNIPPEPCLYPKNGWILVGLSERHHLRVVMPVERVVKPQHKVKLGRSMMAVQKLPEFVV